MASPDTSQHVRLNFTFPTELVNEPVLSDAIKQFGITVDIRQANVEANVGGYIMCEVSGTDTQIDKSVEYLKGRGVGVGFIGADDVSAY